MNSGGELPNVLKPNGLEAGRGGAPSPGESAEQRRNFLATAWYQIVLRVGWIFKTESVIIPAALDSLGASGWVRGFLPVLNRFGQSIPPLLVWPTIRQARYQRHWLSATTLIMSLAFAALAAIWFSGLPARSAGLAQFVFLVLYGLFFAATGVNQLVLSTLIGKLILVRRRGMLMLVSNTRGALFSIFCAWCLLSRWLHEDTAWFSAIFSVSAICFLMATGLCFFLREPPSAEPRGEQPFDLRYIFGGVWQACSVDRQFRMVVVISGLFGMSLTLFPHYQNLARTRLDAGFGDLLPWLITQNLGVAVFSIPAGRLADRHGNRAVLRLTLLTLTLAPVLALVFANTPAFGRTGFSIVYFLLGLTPVIMRTLSNFSLEFAPPSEHPRYLSALTLSMALPVMLTSVLLGRLLDVIGHEFVFGTGIVCLTLAGLLTFVVSEPRDI